MAISQADLRRLYQESGNRCAFPSCNKELTAPATASDEAIILSEVAHIVARKPDGPRGKYPLAPELRDKYDNLILLCEEHHHTVDGQEHFYTVERLRQYKEDHIARIAKATASVAPTGHRQQFVTERVYSTILPVIRMPRDVYGVPVRFREHQEWTVAQMIKYPSDSDVMCPFILREGHLYCFQNLRYDGGPFRSVPFDRRKVRRDNAPDWWSDDRLAPWFAALLNRCLNKLTGRKGLNLDKEHHRYYFEPTEEGQPRKEKYKPLNKASSELSVVWQPVRKKTGETQPYWYHRAISLRFLRVGNGTWALSLRPEMRVTRDGCTSIDSDKIGSRVTHKKSRMFNYDLLSEIQFWRDYLSEGGPRIVFSFDDRGQHLMVNSTLMNVDVDWPGIPAEFAQSFANVDFGEDLFTWADKNRLDEEYFKDDEGPL